MEKCKECGMPLTDEVKCSCQPELCKHCCKCPDDCECGCRKEEKKEK